MLLSENHAVLIRVNKRNPRTNMANTPGTHSKARYLTRRLRLMVALASCRGFEPGKAWPHAEIEQCGSDN